MSGTPPIEPRLLLARTAIVTGAARGIGRAIAELFLRHGANVVAADCDPITGYGADEHFLAVTCDIAREVEVAALVQTAVDRFGGVDCLVNNAARPGSIEGLGELSPARFEQTVQTVLLGTFHGIHHAAPVLRAGGGGSIINIGSTSGLVAAAVMQDYGAAKAGVHMLTRSAAMELASAGIRVNCICPGGIATAFYGLAAGLDADEAETRRDAVAAKLGPLQPLGRAGTPADVANTALWLASDLAAYVTGQIIAVDGGMSVGRPMPPGVSPQAFFDHIARQDAA